MAGSIRWIRLIGEGAVIVGSILLAFFLDAWWDDISRERDLRDQLEVVTDEMRTTRTRLESVLRAHAWNVQLSQQLRLKLGEVEAGSTVLVPDEEIGPLLPQVTADVTTRALQAFIAAGGLKLIDDLDARAELLAWAARMEDLLDDEIYLRNFAAAELVSWLRNNADIANAELLSTPILLGHFGVGPPPDPSLLDTSTLTRDTVLINLLAARESGERAIQSNLEQLLALADRHIATLDASN